MSSATRMSASTQSGADPQSSASVDTWRQIGLAMLAVRFVQGWIYWGGGSRRFIYAPSKLDPHAHSWMANKFQSAMPGAILGTGHIVDYLLHHFHLLYAGVILFSAAELIFGLFLLFGFMTRLSALVTVGLSFVLMLLFGWQGATCIDEWTMASANFAMGAALFLAGGGVYSVDAWLRKRHPQRTAAPWFQWLGSGPWPARRLERWSLITAAVTVAFVVLTYNYYRGSVLTPFHGGPVSAAAHHVSLSAGRLDADGSVRFTAYLDGGTPAAPANIVRADLLGPGGTAVEHWGGDALAALPPGSFVNDYAYNRFGPGYAGITAKMGARATIALPAAGAGLHLAPGHYQLVLHSVDGRPFKLALTVGG
ncbi:MAG: quinol oxidase [Proteobacteria bacterium]|nr:quinol oxidase [Pseudomonadota bacterium]